MVKCRLKFSPVYDKMGIITFKTIIRLKKSSNYRICALKLSFSFRKKNYKTKLFSSYQIWFIWFLVSSDPVAAISSLISFWPQIIKLKSASFHSALLHCLPVYRGLCLHQKKKCYRRKTTKKSEIWTIFPVSHRFQNCYKSCQPLDVLDSRK